MSENADSQEKGPRRVSISDAAGNADTTELGARFVPSKVIHGRSSTAIRLPAVIRIATEKSLPNLALWDWDQRLDVDCDAASRSSNRTGGAPAIGFLSSSFPFIMIFLSFR